jgi:sugar lactone lactonase YvrE
MPCFGGPDLDTLLTTSIVQPGHENDPLAGAVLLVRPGVTGVPDVSFAG